MMPVRAPHPSVPVGALVCAGICAAGLPGLEIPAGLLLALVIPGYALTSTLFAGRELTREVVVLLSLGLSVCIDIVVGVALAIVGVDIGAGSWAAALATVTVLIAIVARRSPAPPAVPTADRWRVVGHGARRGWAAAIAGSLLVGGAIALSLTPLPSGTAEGYAVLAAVNGPSAGTAVVTVTNHHGTRRDYRLRLAIDGTPAGDQILRLAGGEHWRRVVPVAGVRRGSRLVVSLSSAGASGRRQTVRVRVPPATKRPGR